MTQLRFERIKEGAAVWAGYYRWNPHRFVNDYLHIRLKLFQKLLIVMMNVCMAFGMIASRGLGKTFLTAIFCCVRAILYPGSKIVIASGTRGQSIQVLNKIMLELKPRSPELACEIDEKASQVNGTNAILVFKNGSFVKVVTAGESARGNRANILIIDEARLVPKDVIDTILKYFLAQERAPAYSSLSEEERREQLRKEPNKTLWLSSAFFQDHWLYDKCVDLCKSMLAGGKSFICGLPYQVAMHEGLLSDEQVREQMSGSDFTEIKWAMEMKAEFWGVGDGSFFDYNTVSKNRHIRYPMLPASLAGKLNNSQLIRIQPKQPGEKRLLSADIALMSSKRNKNDATSIFINQLMPTKSGRYSNNIIYCEANEGFHTDDEALLIRKLYDEFQCDYIVLDTSGIGLGVFDALARDISDPETGEIYPALSCCNDQEMAARCKAQGAEKVIWSMKANAQMNSNCALLLREGFRSGRIRLLINEYDAEKLLDEIKGFSGLSDLDKAKLLQPYINTTFLINELIRLRHEEVGGRIRMFERAGMRKDRYSSLSYSYYVATQLEAKQNRRSGVTAEQVESFVFRAPNYKGGAVSRPGKEKNKHSWQG